jgi:hypothetical protein
MATGTYSPYVRLQWFDTAGVPLSGGSMLTYAAGTTTPLATYSDVTLSTANPTTITLNTAGVPEVSGTEVAVFLSPGTSYKFVVKDSAGTIVWTRDNISAVPNSAANTDVDGTAGEALTAGTVVYLSDGSGSKVAGRWYTASTANGYSSTFVRVGMVLADIGSGSTGSIRLGGRVTGLVGLSTGSIYYLTTSGAITATAPSTNTRVIGQADSTTSLVLQDDFPQDARLLAAHVCEGRLTLTSGTPVTTTDVTAATSAYFTPFGGNRVSLYDGTSQWNVRSFAEITISLSGFTASKPYDVFLYDNAGVVTAETLIWTDATTRATALVRQDGRLVKSGATTRLYVGTIYINSSGGQTDDSYAKRSVYNAYNRVARPVRKIDTTDTWTWPDVVGNQNVFHAANASTANSIDVMVGFAEEGISLTVLASAAAPASGQDASVAIGEDSQTTPATACLMQQPTTTSTNAYVMSAALSTVPPVGRHLYYWLEQGSFSGSGWTWRGDGGVARVQSGITGMWRA